MAAPCTAVFEVRDEIIVSPGSEPYRRTAYFLKPSGSENPSNFSPLPSLSSEASLDVRFYGWLPPLSGWKDWIDRLLPKHRNAWERAGILEPILNSTYKINKHPDLIVQIAKKWHPETNTFDFGFGEATVTLEDVLIITGFPLLGRPVCASRKLEKEEEMWKAERLEEERLSIGRSKAKKASHIPWIKHFLLDKHGEDVEHEAFLTLWLGRFVFHRKKATDSIHSSLFPLAIKLASGTMFAFGPTILAEIYRDLTVLQKKLYCVPSVSPYPASDLVHLTSPLHILLVWIWERFPLIQPLRENTMLPWMPRQAQWHNAKSVRERESVLAFFENGDDFLWRPYSMGAMMGHQLLSKWYGDHGEQHHVLTSSDEAFRSFARCLRPSELVGLDEYGTLFFEQYSPHRVARQFGYDQDIPGCHPRQTISLTTAQQSYEDPASDEVAVYFPSRFFFPGVTEKYSEWWAGMKLTEKMYSNVERQENTSVAPINNIGVGAEKRQMQEDNINASGAKRLKGKDKVSSSNLGFEKVVLRTTVDLASRDDQYYKKLAWTKLYGEASDSQLPKLDERWPCPPELGGTKEGIEVMNLEEDEAPEEARAAIDVTPLRGLEGVNGEMRSMTKEDVSASGLLAPLGLPRKDVERQENTAVAPINNIGVGTEKRPMQEHNSNASGSQLPKLDERWSCSPGLQSTKDGIEVINLEEDEAPEEARAAIDVTPLTGLEGMNGGMGSATREDVSASGLSAPLGLPRKDVERQENTAVAPINNIGVGAEKRPMQEDNSNGYASGAKRLKGKETVSSRKDVLAPPGFIWKNGQTMSAVEDGVRATRADVLAGDLSAPPGYIRKNDQTMGVSCGASSPPW